MFIYVNLFLNLHKFLEKKIQIQQVRDKRKLL